jgi:hypothetical protein
LNKHGLERTHISIEIPAVTRVAPVISRQPRFHPKLRNAPTTPKEEHTGKPEASRPVSASFLEALFPGKAWYLLMLKWAIFS